MRIVETVACRSQVSGNTDLSSDTPTYLTSCIEGSVVFLFYDVILYILMVFLVDSSETISGTGYRGDGARDVDECSVADLR